MKPELPKCSKSLQFQAISLQSNRFLEYEQMENKTARTRLFSYGFAARCPDRILVLSRKARVFRVDLAREVQFTSPERELWRGVHEWGEVAR